MLGLPVKGITMKKTEKIFILFVISITMMVIIYYLTRAKMLDLGLEMSQVDINIVQSFDNNVRIASVG